MISGWSASSMTVTFLLAAKADKIMDDFTWALATGMSYKKVIFNITLFWIFTRRCAI